MMKLVYLASPYSYMSRFRLISLVVQFCRYCVITRIAGRLHDRHQNVAFILPITASHQTAKFMRATTTTFAAWAKRDLAFIKRSDEVWVVKMDGWKESIGVQAEIRFAKKNKIPVKYINPLTCEFEAVPVENKNKKSSEVNFGSNSLYRQYGGHPSR